MKRLISILLLGVLLCGMVLPASAAVIDPVAPQYKKIISITTSFYVDEKTGIAYCYADCIAESDVTIKIVGTLQQYTNGSWVYVTSWTESGKRSVTLDEQYAVASGYKYRFIARFYIYDSNGSFVESEMASRIYDYNS